MEHPDAIHFKGITISPTGSFIEAATVWRSAATGGDINTAFTGIPLENSNNAQLSEFYGSGTSVPPGLKATGRIASMTMTGYYEMDWLGTGITSNNNQSNSYVLRQRQLWAQAALNSGWKFTGGQMWSLATETTKGLDNGTEILPMTHRSAVQRGFRVDAAVRFPRNQELRQQVLDRRFGGKCGDPESGWFKPAHQRAARFGGNGRRSLQLDRELFLQPGA